MKAKYSMKSVIASAAVVGLFLAVPCLGLSSVDNMEGNVLLARGGGHGPGDGKRNGGDGPKDGSGNGPGTGSCLKTAIFSFDGKSVLASGGNGNGGGGNGGNGGNGAGDCSGNNGDGPGDGTGKGAGDGTGTAPQDGTGKGKKTGDCVNASA